MTRTPDSLQYLTSVISGGQYSLSLENIDPEQILYNGKVTYLTNYARPSSGGWCHLLLLKSKNRYSKQVLAILTQTPDSDVSIVNTIEDIATFVLNFFDGVSPGVLSLSSEETRILSLAPENTIFVEYLPAGCFGPDTGHNEDTFAFMDFKWEVIQDPHIGSYHQASPPIKNHMWRSAHLEDLNDLIERL